MNNEIVEGLQKIRDQVFERLLVNPDYRALRAIDKTINDIIAINEAQAHKMPATAAPPRKEMTSYEDPASIAELAMNTQRQPAPKLNTAPLFPAHRVA